MVLSIRLIVVPIIKIEAKRRTKESSSDWSPPKAETHLTRDFAQKYAGAFIFPKYSTSNLNSF